MTTKLVKLDGKDTEVPETLAPAIEKLNARLDAANEEIAALKVQADPSNIAKAAAARARLLSAAGDVLGAEARFDSLSDTDIKRAVVAKLKPSWDLAGKSDEYVDARFDVALESRADARASHAAASPAAPAAQAAKTSDEDPVIAARKRMVAANRGEVKQ